MRCLFVPNVIFIILEPVCEGAEVAFSSVEKVQSVLSKKTFFVEKIMALDFFHFERLAVSSYWTKCVVKMCFHFSFLGRTLYFC